MRGNPDPGRDQALQDWEAAFGSPPPPYLSVGFMQKALAHEAQCKSLGGLAPATRRALQQIASGKPGSSINTGTIRPGAHLVREWNGRTYQVEVRDGGYQMDGKSWPSLSAIAKHITGTTWSGPRFFGLTSRAGEST